MPSLRAHLGRHVFGAFGIACITLRDQLISNWGNVFYPPASVSGAVVAYGLASPSTPYAPAICKASVILIGLCNASFAVDFLAERAPMVPNLSGGK